MRFAKHPLMECSLQICVFMIFYKRPSGLQRLQGSDFDGKVVFLFFSHENSEGCVAKHMYQNFRSWGSEEPRSKQSGVFVFFICELPLLVLDRFVADGELLALVILMCSVQMMLATMLH